jgi:hypothetical protein
MEQDPRTDDGSGRICRLIKSMYGLPQAAYHAQRMLMNSLKADGIEQTVTDRAVVVQPSSTPNAQHAEVMCSIHCDDSLSAGTTAGLRTIRASLKKTFKITSDTEPTLVIGVQIERSRKHRWLKIHQHGYVLKLLTQENMLDCRPSSTPINKGMTKQSSYDDGLPDTPADRVARTHFLVVFGMLLWLAEKTRKDLRFTVNFYGRMVSYAKSYHLGLIRGQPLRYLNGTRDYGLVYQAGKELKLSGAADADFAGDCVKQRSTIGTLGKLGDFGLIWDGCSLVKCIQTSTGHSETTAAAAWCKEEVSARVQLREFGLAEQGRVHCLVDNAGVVKQAVNTTNHAQAKHYRVAQAYIRQLCDDEEVLMEKCDTDDNPADFFTKALDRGPFEKHRYFIMGPQKNPSLVEKEVTEYIDKAAKSGAVPMSGQGHDAGHAAAMSYVAMAESNCMKPIRGSKRGLDCTMLLDSKPYELYNAAARFKETFERRMQEEKAKADRELGQRAGMATRASSLAEIRTNMLAARAQRNAAFAVTAEDIELNRQMAEQSWKRVERRPHTRSSSNHRTEASTSPSLIERRGMSLRRLADHRSDETPAVSASQAASTAMRACNELHSWGQAQRAAHMGQEAQRLNQVNAHADDSPQSPQSPTYSDDDGVHRTSSYFTKRGL